ncbi:TRAFs-binding domain-containing protein [Desulfovibrio aminophilus]|uniref:TRAFs-binding domain-containing protein n=1 Tax=Desulfovibrio aminophilus TaxID=81425 RepID=UPI0033916739
MTQFCFVLMPFGLKPDESGRNIDFDRIYAEIVGPAIADAGMEYIRADQELAGGIIHKAMFERLMLCDYAVADLTTANANVFYELGVRHGIRPYSTVLIFGKGFRLPFDVAPLRGLPYQLDEHGAPAAPAVDRHELAKRLNAARDPVVDSPLFQLISEFKAPDIARLKTDLFRENVAASNAIHQRLAVSRRKGMDAVESVEHSLNLAETDPAVLIDLFLSYRAVEAWQRMVELVPRLPRLIAKTVMVQEQFGFALNRLERRDEAEAVLTSVITEHGASSETNGILGRVYKDRWGEANQGGNIALAKGYLNKAIETYLAGFEIDWRDAYPGINVVTLMEMSDPVDSRQEALLPVVRYAVERRLKGRTPDYWDHATRLELAVLSRDHQAAEAALANALASVREPWEPKTTKRNLELIRDVREARGENVGWVAGIIESLCLAAGR